MVKACMLTIVRDFATNVGITFQTPEEYFLNEVPHPYARQFDPNAYLNPASSTSTDTSKSRSPERQGTPC